jgi:glyoxylase-like metal-dependent hydrolase (beta-lactamase superfamily II)
MSGKARKSEIDVRELWDRLHGRHEGRWYVLDVRNEEEFARWRVEGALEVPQVNVPYFGFIDDPEKALEQVPRDLGEAVVLCAKGDSSEFVKDVLVEAGLPAVHVAGGMIAWGDLHVPIPVDLDEANPGFELWQFNRYGKGCLSYAVVANGEAAIVDPSRFTELYERFADERGVGIVEVLETHVHADHLSGGADLARRVDARYRVVNGLGADPAFPGVDVQPLENDAPLRIGGADGITMQAQVLRTPGHTPGSTSYLIGGKYLLSGDTVFVQGVGRPDLGGHVEEWGRELHRTLRHVVGALSPDTTVLPAHFAGPGEAEPTGVVRGRLGEIRDRAPEFAIEDPVEFVERMKANIKDPPAIYAEIVKANLGLVDPGEQAGEWELGKNECAATAAKRRASEAAARAAAEAQRLAGEIGARRP